jgi:hypothetical protein
MEFIDFAALVGAQFGGLFEIPLFHWFLGYKHEVFHTPDGTTATIIQDYLHYQGNIRSRLLIPLVGDWGVFVREEDVLLADELLSAAFDDEEDSY